MPKLPFSARTQIVLGPHRRSGGIEKRILLLKAYTNPTQKTSFFFNRYHFRCRRQSSKTFVRFEWRGYAALTCGHLVWVHIGSLRSKEPWFEETRVHFHSYWLSGIQKMEECHWAVRQWWVKKYLPIVPSSFHFPHIDSGASHAINPPRGPVDGTCTRWTDTSAHTPFHPCRQVHVCRRHQTSLVTSCSFHASN